jgi:hypothetical protein
MPDLTLLPNGMYRVTDETGSQYDMEAGFAQQQYPEKFETDFTAANEAKQSFEQYAAENYGGQPVMEQPAEDPALVDALAADLLAQESEMVMEPDVLGQPMVPAEAAPQPVAPQAAPQSQSRSMSYSESGTNPFEVRRSRGFSEAPDFTPEVMAMRDAAQQQQAALGQEQQATEEFQQRSEQVYGDIQAERQYQAQRAQEMHDNAMQSVAEQEAQLAHRMENMTKMDMNKIWKETPQGARVAGMFSAAVAGWLNPTGKNSVIEQMMQMVDQSAREQTANMNLEKFQVQNQQQAIGRFENRAARDRQVFMENRAVVLASLQDGLQMERDKYQSSITTARIDAQIAQVQNEFAKTVQGLKQQAFQNSFARDQQLEKRRQDDANRAQRAAQFRKSMAMRQAEAAAKAKAGQPGAQKGEFLGTFDGRRIYAGADTIDKDDAKKIRASIRGEKAFNAAGNNLLTYLRSNTGRKLTPTERRETEALMAEAFRTLRSETGANLTGIEKQQIDAYLGGAMDILKDPDAAVSILEKTLSGGQRRIHSLIQNSDPVWEDEVGLVQDQETGEVRRAGQGEQPQATGKSYSGVSMRDDLGAMLGASTTEDQKDQALSEFTSDLDTAVRSYKEAEAAGETARAESARQQIMYHAKELAEVDDKYINSNKETYMDLVSRVKAAEEIADYPDVGGLASPSLGLEMARPPWQVKEEIESYIQEAGQPDMLSPAWPHSFSKEEYWDYVRNN